MQICHHKGAATIIHKYLVGLFLLIKIEFVTNETITYRGKFYHMLQVFF